MYCTDKSARRRKPKLSITEPSVASDGRTSSKRMRSIIASTSATLSHARSAAVNGCGEWTSCAA